MMNLPIAYIIDKFFTYAGNPKFNKFTNVYQGSCPICREGKSWLKKRRCYYIVDKNQICCQNENKIWSPLKWIMEVTGDSYYKVIKEASEYDSTINEIITRYETKKQEIKIIKSTHILPHDSINLTDRVQIQYYKDNKIVQDCIDYINQRRLFTAVNKCKSFYISLTDKIHKNRLCIPFFDENNKIVFYQTRAIYKKDEDPSKYLSKYGGTKSVFGIDKIDPNFDYIFIFEGPIDSMFVKNGVAMCSLTPNEFQTDQLSKFALHKKIWVLDNQLDNTDVHNKYKDLIEKEERIFFMPPKFKEKDLNEICVKYKLDKISPNFFVKNSFTGIKAQLKLNHSIQ